MMHYYIDRITVSDIGYRLPPGAGSDAVHLINRIALSGRDSISIAFAERKNKASSAGISSAEKSWVTFANRVVFKNFFESHAMHYVQADCTRLAGVNEFLPVGLLAKRFGLPVVPHVGTNPSAPGPVSAHRIGE